MKYVVFLFFAVAAVSASPPFRKWNGPCTYPDCPPPKTRSFFMGVTSPPPFRQWTEPCTYPNCPPPKERFFFEGVTERQPCVGSGCRRQYPDPLRSYAMRMEMLRQCDFAMICPWVRRDDFANRAMLTDFDAYRAMGPNMPRNDERRCDVPDCFPGRAMQTNFGADRAMQTDFDVNRAMQADFDVNRAMETNIHAKRAKQPVIQRKDNYRVCRVPDCFPGRAMETNIHAKRAKQAYIDAKRAKLPATQRKDNKRVCRVPDCHKV